MHLHRAGVPGHEDWFDIKAVFKKQVGAPYDERRLTVGAFKLLGQSAQRNIFGNETNVIVDALRKFLAST